MQVGAGPTNFDAKQLPSRLFGQGALQTTRGGAVYLDVADDSLGFTGSTNKVGPFTMGAFAWGPANNNKFWFLIVKHNEKFSAWEDIWGKSNKWRLALFLSQGTADSFSLPFTNPEGTNGDYWTYLDQIPKELRSGWVHIAFTYDPDLDGGTLKGYLNGNKTSERHQVALTAYGSDGSYA